MRNIANYWYEESTHIFYKGYTGIVELEDIIATWNAILEKEVIPQEVKGFVVDYSKAILRVEPSGAESIADFYSKHLDIFRWKKVALIMKDPDQVVIPLLVEQQGVEFFPKPFYTKEAAVDWVLE